MRFPVVAVLLGLMLLLTPVAWVLSARYLVPAAPEAPEAATAADVAALAREVTLLRERVDGLETRLAQLGQRPADPTLSEPGTERRDALVDLFADVVLIAGRREVNTGLSHASPAFLKELLGLPREDLTDECAAEMTNETLRAMLVKADVGPINVEMLRPAILSLQQVFRNVEVYEPELYTRIRSAGSLCVRRIRGAEESASAHSYGLAVDLNIDGVLDTLGDGKTQFGLILLADFFQKEGWYWGAGFGREDSMHFEVSREKLEQWRRMGLI